MRPLLLCLLAPLASACSLMHGAGGDTPPPPLPRPPVRDAGSASVDAAPSVDAGPPVDARAPGLCDPMDVRVATCPGACGDPFLDSRLYWNGSACVGLAVCAESCRGTDCASQYSTWGACERAHADCDGTLCLATGGHWLAERDYCGHHLCGHPAPMVCAFGTPACDCGSGSSFIAGLGCAADSTCRRSDLCLATGGALSRVCDSGPCLGEFRCPPGGGPQPGLACHCGPGRRFDESRGCIDDATVCADSASALCSATGGAWEGICCHSVCGELCPFLCAGPACRCGPRQVFDANRGCIDSPMCRGREGGSCEPDAATPCQPGSVCCDNTGGGASGPPAGRYTCVPPCCGPGCLAETGCVDTSAIP